MKRLLLILALPLLASTALAQVPKRLVTNENRAAYRSGMDKFQGTWVYEENGRSFTIVLKRKTEKFRDLEHEVDFIVGYHLYKDGSKVIDGNTKESTITTGSVTADKGYNKIKFRFRETNNAVNAKGTMEFKDGNQDLLIWKLVLTEGAMIIIGNEKKPDYRLHVPNNIVLRRVK